MQLGSLPPQNGRWVIRVFGEPQPDPKKELFFVNGRTIPGDRDYKTRTNPLNGKKEKYDRGYMKRWEKHVQQTVLAYMAKYSLEPFGKDHPIMFSVWIFKTQPKSNKLPYPSQKPDYSNFAYYIENALKRSPKKRDKITKKLIDGKFPEGIAYRDDDQVLGPGEPCYELWATASHPPGAIIIVQDVLKMMEKIDQDLKRIYEQEGVLV